MLLKPFWARLAPAPWVLGALLCAVVVAWRAYLMLGPSHGRGPWLVVHFLTLIAIPFLFLSRGGRDRIGLSAGVSYTWVLAATASGATAAIAIGVLGDLLYSDSSNNWVSPRSLRRCSVTCNSALCRLPKLFPVLAIPAALFSPPAEELFFRGVFHDLIVTRVGQRAALTITGVMFGVMHLFHHGISMDSMGVEVLSCRE